MGLIVTDGTEIGANAIHGAITKIGAGNSNTAAAANQDDLQAGTGSSNRHVHTLTSGQKTIGTGSNSNQVTFEYEVPAGTIGFTINELGLFDTNDKLFSRGTATDGDFTAITPGSSEVVRLRVRYTFS